MKQIEINLHHTHLKKIQELLKYEEPRVIRRCNILSCLHAEMQTSLISQVLHVDPKTIRNTALHFMEHGLDAALFDDNRSGRPIDIDDRERSRIIAMVCANPPSGAYRWTLDLILEEIKNQNILDGKSVSRETVRLILHDHDLKPWREKMWSIEQLTDEYIERMEDVLEVYERPYDPEQPVICVDEKPVALFADSRDRHPAEPGKPTKIDYEYERNGSANVFCGVEPKAGVYLNKVTETRDGWEFGSFLSDIYRQYEGAKKIILVMDNLSTHSENSLHEFLGKADGERLWKEFEVHYTPKHASWLNQAEIAIGMYSRQCLGDGRVKNIDNLNRITNSWNARINKKGTKIQWRFTRSKARLSFGYT
ncbi:MAG: IS630 family transposase [Deltaproteobacteria bacterium]|nr:IS630 family transposase [Deltaproteobacteria bacterium]